METRRVSEVVPRYYNDRLLVFLWELQALVVFKYQTISVHMCQPYFEKVCRNTLCFNNGCYQP